MNRLPGTGLPIDKVTGVTAIMICGENPADVLEAVDTRLAEWACSPLSVGFREFNIYQYSRGENKLILMIGGLGSASVELLMQEAAIAGINKFILGGTCATLSNKISVGEFAVPNHVIFRPGALHEYFDPPGSLKVESQLQQKLCAHLSIRKIKFSVGSVISTDAFYGVGAAVDSNGHPVYAGARLKNGLLPISLPMVIENKSSSDILDMECAPFFGFGHLFEGVEVAAMKVATNRIPWQKDDFHEGTVKHLLTKNIETLLDFIISECL